MLKKIISGGQTGVDRGALDAALAAEFSCGGWCPQGRRAEDGKIPDRYPLEETRSAHYLDRTHRNVEDSDGTLIIARGPLLGGTRATARFAEHIKKPCLVLDPDRHTAERLLETTLGWLSDHSIQTLNVAGPRASGDANIQAVAEQLITRLIRRVTVETDA